MKIGRERERLVPVREVYGGPLVSDWAEEKYVGLGKFARYDVKRTVEYIVKEEEKRRRRRVNEKG